MSGMRRCGGASEQHLLFFPSGPAPSSSSLLSLQADEQLRSLVKKHGPKRWSVISRELKVKTSKQCRRRWKNFLNATRKTGDWTQEEDRQLLDGHRIHGNKWETLAQLVGGRCVISNLPDDR